MVDLAAQIRGKCCTVTSDAPIEEARRLMREESVHWLAVFEGGKLVGTVGQHDLRSARPSATASHPAPKAGTSPAGVRVGDVMRGRLRIAACKAAAGAGRADTQGDDTGTPVMARGARPTEASGITTVADPYRVATHILAFGWLVMGLRAGEPAKPGALIEVMDHANQSKPVSTL
jgi:hypothetical protein